MRVVRIARIACIAWVISWLFPGFGLFAAPAAQQPAQVAGFVFDAAGEPVAGAKVRFRSVERPAMQKKEKPAPRLEWSPIGAVETDAAGAFRIEIDSGHMATLHVTAPGHATRVLRLVAGQTVEVRLKRGRVLGGTVRARETDEPLAGATVRLIDASSGLFRDEVTVETLTDEEGRYRFQDRSSGRGLVTAVAQGHALAELRYAPLEATEDDVAAGDFAFEPLRLAPGARVAGRVVDTDGAAVSGAQITLFESDQMRQSATLRHDARTDSDGDFVLEGIPAPVRYRVIVRADDYPEDQKTVIDLEPGKDEDSIVIVLSRGARLVFRLVDEDDAPVKVQQVALYSETDRGVGGYERGAVQSFSEYQIDAGEDGRAEVAKVTPGTFTALIHPEIGVTVVRDGVVVTTAEATDLGTLRVEAGNVVAGTVVDATGEPLGGAGVQATWALGRKRFRRKGKSDGEGAFRIAGLAERSVKVHVGAKGFAPLTLQSVEPGTTDLLVRLERHGRLGGEVAFRGEPPAGFSVRLISENTGNPFAARMEPAYRHEAEPGASGYELTSVNPGAYTVEIEARGFKPARAEGVEVAADRETRVPTITLEPGSELRGRVVRSADGSPVRGARALLLDGAAPGVLGAMLEPLAAQEVDEGGAFAFDGLAPGGYRLTVEHREFASASRPVTVDPEAEGEPVVVELSAGGEISGTVRSSERLPVADVDIMLMRGFGGDVRRTSSGADGVYRFARVAAGRYNLVRQSSGARSPMDMDLVPAAVEEGEVTVIDFDDESPITLSGSVLLGEEPLPRARLSFMLEGAGVRLSSATTDEAGRYTLGLERSGSYAVMVASVERGSVLGKLTLAVPDEPVVVRDLVLAGGAILGRVLDGQGEPIAGARVLAGTAAGEIRSTAVSGADGGYRLDGLEAGEYRLVASAESYGTAQGEPVSLAAGTQLRDVDLLLRGGREARGRVVDPSGNPVAGATVLDVIGGVPGETRVTAPDGAFVVSPPETGAIELWVLVEGWAPARSGPLSAGAAPDGVMEIRLTAGGALRARVIDGADAPLGNVRVDLISRNGFPGTMTPLLMTDGDGMILFEHVAPGSYAVGVQGGQRIEVTVTAGQTTEALLVR